MRLPLNLLHIPHAESDERRRGANVIVLSISLIAITLLLLPRVIAGSAEVFEESIRLGVIFVWLALIVAVARWGRVTLAATALIGLIVLTLIVEQLIEQEYDLSLCYLCFGALVAGGTLRLRGIAMVTLLSGAGVFALALLLPGAPAEPVSGGDLLLTSGLLCVFAGLVGGLGAHNTARTLQEVHQARVRAEQAQAALAEANLLLEQRVAERTAVLDHAQAALQASERQREQMLWALIDGVVVVDTAGQITYANRAAAEILHLSRDAIMHRYFSSRDWRQCDAAGDPLPAEQLPLAVALTSHQEVVEYEHGLIAPDGTTTWLSVNAAPLFGNDGTPSGAVASFRDITPRKQAEDALRATTSRLTSLIESLQAGVMFEDEDRRVVLVNPAFCTMFSVPATPAQLIGADCAEAAEASKTLFADPSGFLQGIGRLLSKRQPVVAEEMTLADGRIYERDYVPIFVDEEYLGHLWQYRDITPRKRAEATLHSYTDRLGALYSMSQAILSTGSPDAIAQAALTHLCRLIPCNEASVAVFDSQTQQAHMIATHPASPTEPSCLSDYQPILDMLTCGEVARIDDLELLDTSSPLCSRMLAAGVRSCLNAPLRDQEALIGVLHIGAATPGAFTADHITIAREVAAAVAIAIRQAQLHEQTRRDAETRATLLREVNHRVKNNLAAIIGLLYAEQRHAAANAQPLYSAIIKELAARVQGLATVHQLLAAADWRPLRLSHLARQIIQPVVQASACNGSASVAIADAAAQVTPDQAHNLALVLNELATNAVKYAAPDAAGLRLRLDIASDDGQLHLELRDNGPGYPTAMLYDSLYAQSVGFDLITNIVRQSLRGTLELANEDGAVTRISFPAAVGQ